MTVATLNVLVNEEYLLYDLNNIISEFDPDLIGVSAMTFHKDFFHKSIKKFSLHFFERILSITSPFPSLHPASATLSKCFAQFETSSFLGGQEGA